MAKKPQLMFEIEEMKLEDIEPATRMRLQSWLDTYPNDQYGVSREWVKTRNRDQLSPEKIASRRERFIEGKQNGTFNAWIARSAEGKIIGSTTPFKAEDETWRLGSLYVDKNWHGKGVAGQLMQKVIDWINGEDVYLEVASYNERAKAFYRKWGFEEIPDSESLFAGNIPEIKMVRKAMR